MEMNLISTKNKKQRKTNNNNKLPIFNALKLTFKATFFRHTTYLGSPEKYFKPFRVYLLMEFRKDIVKTKNNSQIVIVL